MNFVYGIILLATGLAFIKYARQLNDFFGMPTFNFFSSGHQAYKTFGVIMIFFSPLLIFGVFDLSSSKDNLNNTKVEQVQQGSIQLTPR